MKKIQYIAPSIKVANVKLQNILAGSDPDLRKDQTEGVGGWGNAQSKGGSFEDDDEEDF